MTDAPDVFFVIIDSARTDRLSTYGHHRRTTPTLDELAGRATLYENAFTPAPWTLPSHCSMFTGRFPSEHGITNGFTDRNLELSSDYTTLAEGFSDRGYATAGFSNNPWVGQLTGLSRGFDRYVEWDLEISRADESADTRRRDALYSRLHRLLGRAAGQPHAILKRRFFTRNLVDRAEGWLTDSAPVPAFTFMNLMEAHSPYYPPKAAFRDLGLAPPGAIEARTLNTKLLAYVLGRTDLAADTRERVMEFYDASLRFQDGMLGSLLAHLRARNLFEDAMIVVCADHGKTLGDYDRHGTPPHYVRDVNVNVPLLIKWPRQREPARVDAPVELVDLYEAMLDPTSTGELPVHDDGALVEDHVPHTAREATDVVRWRVLADRTRKFVRSDDDEEFFFDRADGEVAIEATAADRRSYRNRLQSRVETLASPGTQTSDAPGAGEVDGVVQDQLEDLGYLH